MITYSIKKQSISSVEKKLLKRKYLDKGRLNIVNLSEIVSNKMIEELGS
jgi:hypothetical protein